MRKIGAVVTAVLALTTTVEPASAVETRLTPIEGSAWVLNYGEDKCRLSRVYGDVEHQTAVIFDQFEPGVTVTATIAGDALRRYARGKIDFRLVPVWTEAFSFEPTQADLEGFGPALVMNLPIATLQPGEGARPVGMTPYDADGLPGFAVDFAASVDGLELSRGGDSLVVELPELPAALGALNACMQDFVGYWGLDVEAHRGMTRRAEPINLQEIAEEIMDRYPSAALHHGEQATIHVRIIVDADGSIEDCAIDDITTSKYLDSAACDAFGDRAMFAPAEDAAGDPMRSYYTTRVVYSLD